MAAEPSGLVCSTSIRRGRGTNAHAEEACSLGGGEEQDRHTYGRRQRCGQDCREPPGLLLAPPFQNPLEPDVATTDQHDSCTDEQHGVASLREPGSASILIVPDQEVQDFASVWVSRLFIGLNTGGITRE